MRWIGHIAIDLSLTEPSNIQCVTAGMLTTRRHQAKSQEVRSPNFYGIFASLFGWAAALG